MLQTVWNEVRRLYTAYDDFVRDDGPLMAAAAAYFIGLSLFPLLSVLVACTGWVLASTSVGQDAEAQVMRAVEQHASNVVALQVQEMLAQVREKSSTSGPIGFAILVFTATAGFSQFERAFDRIWNLPASNGNDGLLGMVRWFALNRLAALLMVLLIGAIVLLAFLASTIMVTVQNRTRELLPTPDMFWTMIQMATSTGINLFAFTLLYKWLPKTHVAWLDALKGGLIAAVAWELGRQVLAAFLIGTKYSSAYGVVGTFLGILAWCYYACTILFVAAEYVQRRGTERAEATAA